MASASLLRPIAAAFHTLATLGPVIAFFTLPVLAHVWPRAAMWETNLLDVLLRIRSDFDLAVIAVLAVLVYISTCLAAGAKIYSSN